MVTVVIDHLRAVIVGAATARVLTARLVTCARNLTRIHSIVIMIILLLLLLLLHNLGAVVLLLLMFLVGRLHVIILLLLRHLLGCNEGGGRGRGLGADGVVALRWHWGWIILRRRLVVH